MWIQTRRSIKLPIVLAIVMIVMLVALTIGWVIMSARSAIESSSHAPLYWTLLSVGTTFYVLIVVGVVLYLTLSIKAINITRRQSNFIDSVTHELKSPIASLKLYLQTMTRRQVSPDEQREFLRLMLDDVERLDQLINHVLDAARLDKEPTETRPQLVALDELIAKCAVDVCGRRRVDPSTVTLDLVPSRVRARAIELELIFRNLLDNAIKYAGNPPQVSVSLRQDQPGRLRVSISDNGRGIPLRERSRVFGRFVRLGTELEREQAGLGLGLYIVRTLVARLRGRVSIQGRGTESGTTFEVELPGTIEHSATHPAVEGLTVS